MDREDAAMMIGLLIFVALMAFGACYSFYGMGRESGERDTRQAAVNAGVAEWTVDSKGVKGFRWLSPAESK